MSHLSFTDLTHLGYGSRIALFSEKNPSQLAINPRGKIGKIGVNVHTCPLTRIFYNTIKIKAVDSTTQTEKEWYLNRSSTIKWLNAQIDENSQIPEQASSEFVLELLRGIGETIPTHHTPRPSVNTSHVDSLCVRLRALFWRLILALTSTSFALYALRVKIFSNSEDAVRKGSEALACCAYRDAAARVTAYQSFLGKGQQAPTLFSTIPCTSKDNYIKKYVKDLGELSLYRNGILPPGSKKDTSTGTSGKPTSWYRGPQEQHSINRSVSISARLVLGNRPYYLINGFALGPWATGISIATAASYDDNATVCNIGINPKEILQAIKDAIQILPKDYPIIIAGYPPHLKEVVDLANQEGIPLHEHDIRGLVGGESMSENQRQFILSQAGENGRTGFKQCYSAYGASDLDVTIGYETDFAIEFRQALCSNQALAKELLGENEFVPMVFPYDPMNYHIETDEKQNLLFTCVRGDRISPRVRYDLGDRGKIMPMSDALAALKKYGFELKNPPRARLPLLFVWGRVGSQITIEGVNMAPENLDDALKAKSLLQAVEHYGFYQYESEDGTVATEILIEPKEGAMFDESTLHQTIVEGLKSYNQEFYKLATERASPTHLRLFKPGTSPMAIQRGEYPHRKKQYIFREGDEFVNKTRPISGTLVGYGL